jgi:hypothetical protein
MIKTAIRTTLAVALCAAAGITAYAAVIVDDDGIGFVGKGDVQLKFEWSNAQLQHAVTNNLVKFQISATEVSVTETTWTCDRDAGPQTAERANRTTTTTTTHGLLSSPARLKNQVTGFNLNGFVEGASTVAENSVANGPAVGSCATGWTAINMVTSQPVLTSTGGLKVSGDGGATYVDLPNTPTL